MENIWQIFSPSYNFIYFIGINFYSKHKAITISLLGFIFAILILSLTFIEEFVFFYFFSKETIENITLADYDMSYYFGIITFSILEVTTFLEIGIWYIEKNRVELGLDIPPPNNKFSYRTEVKQTTSSGRKTIYEPNKRKKSGTKLKDISNNKIFLELHESEFEIISIEI